MNVFSSVNAEAKVATETADQLWYKDAIIYQLHVKAFADSNNDGIGPVMIGDVADDERPPLHEVAVTGGEIVIDDRNKAGLGNGLGAMGSDISRAARDEDRTPARH